MSLLNILSEQEAWVDFYEQKVDPVYFRMSDAKELFHYVRQKKYLPVVDRIMSGQGLSVPKKKKVAKSSSSRKRVVYSLPEDETTALKFLTWLMIRKYDDFFSDNLYSFRPGYGPKDALRKILACPGISQYRSYRMDIHDYFNSIDVELLFPIINELMSDDLPLCEFLHSHLSDTRVIEDGIEVNEYKGIMAGIPFAVFLANVYLTPLDRMFDEMSDVIYCRYSDDIIIFTKEQETLDSAKKLLHDFLRGLNLEINPDKVSETGPGQPWTFLGFECDGQAIDVSKVSVGKLKAKMRRKARALRRWKDAEGKEDWMAAKAFVKYFNRKLFSSDDTTEINWSWWYFPMITTDRSLKELDAYMQDCVRYVATGKRTKSRYNFRYEQMKSLGMVSLVNAWYRYRKEGACGI